jgi:hypothetical protein
MKRKVLAMLCLLTALSAVSLLWAREDHLVSSTLAPAARGTVHSETDRNGNTGLKVEVKHLAKPHDLQSGYSSYVVWVQPRGQSPTNAGELRVNDDLQGSLETSTPYKQFDLFVTAENNPRVTAPTGPQILHTTVSRE